MGDLANEERSHAVIAEQLGGPAHAGRQPAGRSGRGPPAVRAAGDPAGAGGADGRLGLDAGAAVCRRVRDRQNHGADPNAHWFPFKVGLAASLGAGISMGFAEALSDDGSLTGRGHPWLRGIVCGLMTTLGGIGHTLPYLIANVHVATHVAIGVVLFELVIISWIRHRYMDTPWITATIQVIVGGVLVYLTGMYIGTS